MWSLRLERATFSISLHLCSGNTVYPLHYMLAKTHPINGRMWSTSQLEMIAVNLEAELLEFGWKRTTSYISVHTSMVEIIVTPMINLLQKKDGMIWRFSKLERRERLDFMIRSNMINHNFIIVLLHNQVGQQTDFQYWKQNT